MASLVRILPACLLILCLPNGRARGQPEPMPSLPEVTTDTQEYCLHLQRQVSGLVRTAGLPREHPVIELSREGQLMCDQGRTRIGIQRLRRAMVILRQDMAAP
jgi:hypothetical protein